MKSPESPEASADTDPEVLSRALARAEAEISRLRAELADRERESNAWREQAHILDQMTEGVSVTNTEGVIVYTNPAEDRMFGYGEGELVGKPASVKSAPGDDPRIEDVSAQLRTKGAWTGEWVNKRKDGSLFHTRIHLMPVLRGGLPHWLCVQEDITEQVAAREHGAVLAAQLAARERQLRLITDAIPATIGYVGTDLRYQFANRAYQTWFGIDPCQVLGMHVRDLLGAERFAFMEPYIQRALAGETVSYENELLDLDGRIRYTQPNYIPDRDELGRVRGFVILVLDITDRRRAELAVAAERERLQTILMEAPAAISIRSGANQLFTLANPVYEQLMGVSPLVGRTAREALPDLAHQGYTTLLEEVYRTGRPMSIDEARLTVEGATGHLRERFFNLSYQPMRDMRGEVDSVVTFGVEVTELVEARRRAESLVEQAEAANRAKDEFLAMLGHELRNPLAPVLTAVQLMRIRDPSAFERERTVIEKHVRHMTRLVDDLLDVSRITRNKISLERHRLDLRTCISTAIELATPLLQQRNHQLSIQLPSPLYVDGDATRLGQVFANLLMNAAKYTPPLGQISVGGEHTDSKVRVWVRDSGVGLTPEMMGRVFELFVQERQTLDRAEGGLGLGLAIVHSLVTLHGGHVEVQSEGGGKGSTFVVTLPAASAEVPPPSLATQESIPGASTRASGRRILVVDDNADAASMLASALEYLGHTVYTAYDALAALRLLEGFVPEVALLDIGLPVMDGYQLAQRIRAHRAARGALLIAVTGYGDDETRRNSQEAGFDHHLAKPVDLARLARLIAAHA